MAAHGETRVAGTEWTARLVRKRLAGGASEVRHDTIGEAGTASVARYGPVRPGRLGGAGIGTPGSEWEAMQVRQGVTRLGMVSSG